MWKVAGGSGSRSSGFSGSVVMRETVAIVAILVKATASSARPAASVDERSGPLICLLSPAPRSPLPSLPMNPTETQSSPYIADAYANDRAHVFHSWSAQGALNPTVIAGAKGSRMWDDKGNSWLDFSSQLVNLNIGHQHPKLVAAIQEQAG